MQSCNSRVREFAIIIPRRALLHLLLLASLLRSFAAQTAPPTSPTQPIPVKVVVVAMFERGEDTGDTPGEYQLWVEREHLDHIFPLPAGYHHVRMNKDGVLGMLTGVGTAKAAASVMAVGLDPRFDFSKAYWIVAGIGGGDPADVSLGSAIWCDYVVDGDLSFEIDARQIPDTWPTGYIPLRRGTPYEQPPNAGVLSAPYVYRFAKQWRVTGLFILPRTANPADFATLEVFIEDQFGDALITDGRNRQSVPGLALSGNEECPSDQAVAD